MKKAKYEVKVWKDYQDILDRTQERKIQPEWVERFQFYERAKKAYAVIQSGYVMLLVKYVFIKNKF